MKEYYNYRNASHYNFFYIQGIKFQINFKYILKVKFNTDIIWLKQR